MWHPWTVSKVSDDDYTLDAAPDYNRDLDVVAVTTDGLIAAYVGAWVGSSSRPSFAPVCCFSLSLSDGWKKLTVQTRRPVELHKSPIGAFALKSVIADELAHHLNPYSLQALWAVALPGA
ncbi:MAG: hypothetical protein ACJ8CR_16145 [Roseiflexaceae bacterium]